MLQRKKPLARGPGPTRKTGLCRQSRTRRREKATQAAAYAEAKIEKAGACFTCKKWAPLDPSHLFPQGMNKQLRAVPANIVGECRACHACWGERLSQYARLYPDALREKVALMAQVSPSQLAFWMMKNEHLLTETPGLATLEKNTAR